MTKIGQYLLGSNLRASFVALLCALLPWPLSITAAIIVNFVTLSKGAKSGLAVLAWVALPSIALMVLRQVSMYDFTLIFALFAYLIALYWRRFPNWRQLILGLVIIAAAVVLVVHMIHPDVKQIWQSAYNQFKSSANWPEVFKAHQAELDKSFRSISSILTGLAAAFAVFMLALSLWLARHWRNEKLGDYCVHKAFSIIAFLMFVTAGFVNAGWLVDLLPLVLLPFIFGALSLLHAVAEKKNFMRIALACFYALLILFTSLMVFVLVLLAVVGFIDSWFNFRQRQSFCIKKG